MGYKQSNCIFKIILSVLLLLALIDMIFAGEEHWEDEGDGKGSGDDVAEELNDALARGESYSGTAPTNTQVNLPGGGTATVGGSVIVNQGQISHAV